MNTFERYRSTNPVAISLNPLRGLIAARPGRIQAWNAVAGAMTIGGSETIAEVANTAGAVTMTQGTVGQRPTQETGLLNGKPGRWASFDGGDHLLGSAALPVGNPFTFILIAKSNADAGTQRVFSQNTTADVQTVMSFVAPNIFRFSHGNGDKDVPCPAQEWFVAICSSDTATLKMMINDGPVAASATNNAVSTAQPCIGVANNTGGAERFKGKWSLLEMYDRDLFADDEGAVTIALYLRLAKRVFGAAIVG
jgi:hypothetical protein